MKKIYSKKITKFTSENFLYFANICNLCFFGSVVFLHNHTTYVYFIQFIILLRHEAYNNNMGLDATKGTLRRENQN